MKKLLAFLLLAGGCSAPATSPLTPTQAAVETHLKTALDDPASYVPVRWGAAEPFSRGVLANIMATEYMKSNIRTEREKGYALVKERGEDTTRQGMTLVHAFRTKNKMGALVLDSARFFVSDNGDVAAIH